MQFGLFCLKMALISFVIFQFLEKLIFFSGSEWSVSEVEIQFTIYE